MASDKKPIVSREHYLAAKFSGVMGGTGSLFYEEDEETDCCNVQAGCPQMAYEGVKVATPHVYPYHWVRNLSYKFSGEDFVGPSLPTVFLLAGTDYEPPGNWVCQGFIEEILDDPDRYLKHFSVAAVGIANPDGYSWASSHVIPYGNAYPPLWWGKLYSPNPESRALVAYMNQLRFGKVGSHLRLVLSLQADLAPHPASWIPEGALPTGKPPIYGFYNPGVESGSDEVIARFVEALAATPTCGPYVRPFAETEGRQHWKQQFHRPANHEDFILIEYDESVLYRTPNMNRPEMPEGQQQPEPFEREGYWIDGNFTTSETYVWFGRDLAKAVLSSYFKR